MLARQRFLVPAIVLLLAGATLYAQYRGIDAESKLPTEQQIEEVLKQRHDDILDGVSGDPWRYRLLSEWGAEASYEVADGLGFDRPATVGFMGFRLLQNLAIFTLAWVFYRRLGLRQFEAALGLGLLGWGMSQALYHGDFSFNTYGDLVMYLAAAVLILAGRYWWVVPLAALAALNRETSGLIGVMLIATGLVVGRRTDGGRRALGAGAAALAAFAATYGAVRLAVGPSFYIEANGRTAGFELLDYNLFRGITWDHLFQTLTIVPLLAVAAWRNWPRELVAFGLAIVPAWFLIHVFTSVLAETRLVLVPLALVFIPGALAGIAPRSPGSARRPAAARSA